MNPLDLTKAPPRAPRAPLGDLDLIMAGRSVDKIRATLPGGNIGVYQLSGYTSRMLDSLGIAECELRECVARARDDSEVAAWLRERVSSQKVAEVNAKFEERRIRDRLSDPNFLRRYPLAADLSPDLPLVDMLALDDERHFAVK